MLAKILKYFIVNHKFILTTEADVEIKAVLHPAATQFSDHKQIRLKEENGDREISMMIQDESFIELSLVLNNADLRAPLVQQFLCHIVQALNGSIVKLVIYELTDFYKAKLYLKDERAEMNYALEINVIDGIIIASVCGCPIFVEDEVFKKHYEHLDTAKDACARMLFDSIDWKKAPKN